jgi:hypothetical protein
MKILRKKKKKKKKNNLYGNEKDRKESERERSKIKSGIQIGRCDISK